MQVVCCQVPTPNPVPIGKTYNYTCPSTNETTSFIQMLVTVPGNAPIAPPDTLGTLASRGVVVIGPDTVYFHANTSNNNTIVSCTYKKTAVIYNIDIIFTVYGTSAITRIVSSFTCKFTWQAHPNRLSYYKCTFKDRLQAIYFSTLHGRPRTRLRV